MDPFVHLHVASAYSLRYGVATPDELVGRAVDHGMEALAVTDRDGLYGAVKHVLACARAPIWPIVGVDLALDAGGEAGGKAGEGGDRRPRPPGEPARRAKAGERGARDIRPERARREKALPRVTLLARGGRGWASLCRLISATHRAGPRGAPVTTPELIAEHGEDLVLLLGPGSDVGRASAAGRPDLAARRLARWRELGTAVIEIVDQYGPGESRNAARMLRLAREHDAPAVLSNQVRYLDPADAPVAQVLDAARQLVPLDMRYLERPTTRASLKSGKEMEQVAERVCGPDRTAVRELLAGTRRLAEQCVLDPRRDLGIRPDAAGLHLPEVPGDAMALLRERCAAGLTRRGLDRDDAAAARLEAELDIIARKGLAAYFLVVGDVAELIRGRGIRCAIRGSGAGCLVNYLLGIGEINPIDHGLLMERFLADSREGLPDIDLDVESARRLDAYDAIFERYGEARVACVSMLETYRARSAIRDVADALGLPPHEIDAIAKAFPHVRARQIRDALTELPELRSSGLARGYARGRLAGMFRLAERLDGLPRHLALHPCGVLIGNAALLDRTPVEASLQGYPMSQFDKDDVEEMGMLKLDVIGVRMQSAMAHAVAEISRTGGGDVDLDAIPRDDPATYTMIQQARTLGCFQIESPGQRELVAKMIPRDMNDLALDISLFRPGPVNADMVTPFLEVRHQWRRPSYPHDDLADVLRESGGVIVFHEQVLRIIDVMTGCGLSEAERLRRRLGDERGTAEAEAQFRAMALASGYSPDVVDRVWEALVAFGAFGFCKAHAVSFALPTYQSAWLKRHHTAAFFAGVLTHDPGMYPKRALLDDARHFGIRVLPLDVNRSAATWRVEPPDPAAGEAAWGIRVALAEVKGISEAEVDGIVAGQPYTSLTDFWHRAGVSRPVVERIVLVGGFDSLYGIRIPGTSAGADAAGDRVPDGAFEPASGASPPVVPSADPPADPSAGDTRSGDGAAGGDVPHGGRPGRRGVSRRDLLAQVGALDRAGVRLTGVGAGRGAAGGKHPPVQLPLGVVERVPFGELAELTATEAVEAELRILGIDVSRHVIDFYTDLLAELGVVRACDLLRCRSGSDVIVAGVKIATQTPAVRSGQRIIFATVEDATGPVDATFFESVQEHCAATVFGSWLLAIRGRIRRTGGRAVSLNAEACWDLVRLHEIWRESGRAALRAYLRGQRGERGRRPAGHGRRIVYANGFALSPYADITPPDGAVKHPPAKLWHASGGSSGGWAPRTPRP